MKATALVAAALLACGSAAFAQTNETARTDQESHGQANQKMRDGAHRLGERVRHGMHRLGDKLHARNDKNRGEQHARNDHRNDTRAMGASGSDSGRRQRMDDAYANWRAKQDRQQNR